MKNSPALASSSGTRGETTLMQQSRHILRDGTTVVIRPIEAADVDLERDFIERLSPQSRRYRFLASMKTPSTELLRQLTQPQLTRGEAYIALVEQGSEMREIGVCRYSSGEEAGSCECAVAVSDEWQNKGLATILMHRLVDAARRNGFERMYSIDASDNQQMRHLAGALGFKSRVHPDDPTLVLHTLSLRSSEGTTMAPGEQPPRKPGKVAE